MLLSNKDIRHELRVGNLIIEPLEDNQIRPASVDLRLYAAIIQVIDAGSIDYRTGERTGSRRIQSMATKGADAGHIVFPGGFILGATEEIITIPNYMAGQISGKSSLARDGLIIECAGFVDPGWKAGRLTLEIKNIGSECITLYPGMLIAHIQFQYLHSAANPDYSEMEDSHYKGSMGPVGNMQEAPVVKQGPKCEHSLVYGSTTCIKCMEDTR